jgi:FkbM family methyltransferase
MTTPNVDKGLIFDLGAHHGRDAEYYLQKGFRVVAVEANPAMTAIFRQRLSKHIEEGTLVVVEKALWWASGEELSFYVNAQKDDWSSLFRNWAEKEGHKSQEIKVSTVTLSELFDTHGVPYYVKCDIEGADSIFADQLMRETRRPTFVSVEASTLLLMSKPVVGGYDRIQIVNQSLNHAVKAPNPPREGRWVDVKFNDYMSGLFGRELPEDRWTDFTTAARRYLTFKSLKQEDPAMARGWLDLHFTTAGALK